MTAGAQGAVHTAWTTLSVRQWSSGAGQGSSEECVSQVIVPCHVCPHRSRRDCCVRGSLRPLPRSNVLGAFDSPLCTPELGHGRTGFTNRPFCFGRRDLKGSRE